MSELNEQQMEVVNSTASKILVLAGAGAGKTHTMLARINELIKCGESPRHILVLTFTNKAAFDMKERYKQNNKNRLMPEFRTFHSFCYHLLVSDTAVRNELGYSQPPTVCNDATLKNIETKAKMQIGCKLSNEQIRDYTLCKTARDQASYKLLAKNVRRLLKADNLITFQILAEEVTNLFVADSPLIKKYKDRYKYIFIDEFQDTDPQQVKFIESFHSTNFCVIGDSLQCQPAGTKVKTGMNSEVNIEDIVPGDRVLSYCPKDGYYRVDSNLKRVNAVSSHIAGNIVQVSSIDHSSRYTTDHITYAKIHFEGNEHKRVVYLMHNEQKGWWRIGECSLFLNNGVDFGPRHRMHEEKGSQVWILKVCENSREVSWQEEQMAAFKFGIPDTTWQFANTYRYTEQTMQTLYDNIPDIYNRARQCLTYYGLDIRYPFFDASVDYRKHFSKLHQFEVRVCNLIPEIMDIVVPKLNEHNRLCNTYEQIVSIVRRSPERVYSLDIDVDHNYVADGILTHNCIYQFRGCSNATIKRYATDDSWKHIRLSENYRSTVEICEFANNMSTYADSAYRIKMNGHRHGDKVTVISGARCDWDNPVDEYHTKMLIDRLKSRKTGDKDVAVLCRTNKEVQYICQKLKDNQILYSSGKRNEDSLNILKSVYDNEFMLDWLSSFLTAEKYAEYIRLAAQQENPDVVWFATEYKNVPEIQERGKTIVAIRQILRGKKPIVSKVGDIFKVLGIKAGELKAIENEEDIIPDLISLIEDQGDQDIYVGTIHSSKGLEYDTVYIMGVNDRSFRLGEEDMNNLYYVAITRAKNHLTIFSR